MLIRYKGGRSQIKIAFSRVYYHFTQENGFVSDVPEGLANNLVKTGKFTVYIKPKEEIKVVNKLLCPHCNFVAKSEQGLIVHSKKHERKGK